MTEDGSIPETKIDEIIMVEAHRCPCCEGQFWVDIYQQGISVSCPYCQEDVIWKMED